VVSIERRFINSNDKWEFDSIYYDGLEGGKKREKEYAKCFKNKNDGVYEYKVEIDGTHKKIN
tara:strand:- start:177 stop:362 length:186 start_codon:yes stop_codon:yes gene_type:complete